MVCVNILHARGWAWGVARAYTIDHIPEMRGSSVSWRKSLEKVGEFLESTEAESD